MLVATERCTEYIALSTGCRARRAFLIGLGVMARFTARPGCTARRTLRGTSNLEKKPTSTPNGPGSPYALLPMVRRGTRPASLGTGAKVPTSASLHHRDPDATYGALPVVLTDLLTTVLDDRGHDRTEKPGEQGRSDPVDGIGRL